MPGVQGVLRHPEVRQAQVPPPIHRREEGVVLDRHQLARPLGLRAPGLVQADAVVGEGDVGDLGVASGHVAGGAVVAGRLLPTDGLVQAARLVGVTVEAFLAIERHLLFRCRRAMGIVARGARQSIG